MLRESPRYIKISEGSKKIQMSLIERKKNLRIFVIKIFIMQDTELIKSGDSRQRKTRRVSGRETDNENFENKRKSDGHAISSV